MLILTVLAVAARRSAYLVLSPAALRQRNFLRDREFDWHMISDISAAEEDHGDVITITCDRSGVRQYRRVKFSGWRRDTGRPDGTLKLPALSLGVESVGLYEALICLQRDPALRERLSPELMTELLIDGFESPVLVSRSDG
ncbi:hypothetical protein [Nocardia rhizosphaerae]|uniref:Uncharacterized protein n=1 Tax=Nocardia rhizosphaerae TaxID=1691571 RepID=A0ABV8KZK4_9NOCA